MPFRAAEITDTLVMGLFSGSGSPSTILFSGGLSVMYLFSVTCWVPDTRAPHAQKHISWGISEGISGKKPLEARTKREKQPLYGQKTDPFLGRGRGCLHIAWITGGSASERGGAVCLMNCAGDWYPFTGRALKRV